MKQTRNSWFARLCGGLRRAWRSGKPVEEAGNARHGLNDRGLLVFAHTGEVIRAERTLREAGFTVEVKGPPPRLRTGCDMVVVFPLLSQAAVLERLKQAGIEPEQVVSAHDVLLEPVSLFQTKRLGRWLMVRAANMKITIDTADERIVNISGGGQFRQMFLQPGVDGPAARARAGISGQKQARRGKIAGCAGQQRRGRQSRRAAPHRHAASVGQKQRVAVHPALCCNSVRGQGEIRIRNSTHDQPHARCLRNSSKAFCKL